MKGKLIFCTMLVLSALAGVSCTREETPDYDGGYGYVQFKIYKEASYNPDTRAIQSQLDRLSDACKVKVTLICQDETITQSLVLSSASVKDAEWGLRSEKLKLYEGDYTVMNFTLYDALDQELYIGVPQAQDLKIERGGLKIHDLTANVVARGSVRFSFTKDLSSFRDTPQTKAVLREYTFDEIAFVDLTVSNKVTGERESFEKVPAKFEVRFSEEGSGDGHQTSVLVSAETHEIKAGEYRVTAYNTYSKEKILLERNTTPAESTFTVRDNETSDAKVKIRLYESDDYIRDYYALYEIWKALDGPNWFFNGQDFNRGSNWDFNKDPDLWGDQPGVQLYSNGRVAMINLEGYNFKGDLPAAIGQLTELNQLYLGNHNDRSFLPGGDPTIENRSRAKLFEFHKARMEALHFPTPMSEPVARALKENGVTIPETAMYDHMKESELIEQSNGNTIRQIRLMDNVHGVYSNGLTSIDPAIGRLKNLEYLYIANSPIAKLPDEISRLSSLTDFELYNCPKMTEFPMAICDLPALVSVNLSNNSQWSPAEVLKGLKGLATGRSADKIQILYLSQNNLEELPEEIKYFKAMGLFDVMSNKIRKVAPFGHGINLVDCYLDDNQIEEIGRDEQGYFCGIEDVETFSVTYNRLKKLPDIFSSKSPFPMTTVDFSYNQIDGVEKGADGSYRGLTVSTLTLANNRIKTFPVEFSESESMIGYINLRANGMESIPEEALKGGTMVNLTSLDLTYNHLTELPEKSFNSLYLPYLYGVDISNNRFSKFPYCTLDSAYLTVLGIRGQRDENGNRCLREWPTGIYQHKGLRGLYLGSNDLRKVSDTISTLIYYLDISDNPNIIFDATDICYAWRAGAYILLYDKTQNIINCDYMLK